MDPTKRIIYIHLFLLCSNPVGVVRTSVRKITLATGFKGKIVEQAIDGLSSDGKVFVCGDLEVVLMDYPKYLPSCGTLAQTLASISSCIAKISNPIVVEKVRESFGCIGVHIDEIDSPMKHALCATQPGSSLSLFSTDLSPKRPSGALAVSVFPSATTQKRSHLSVTDSEVDLYIDTYNKLFGDISPMDYVPGEKKGVTRSRRTTIKCRISEMGPEWEVKLEEILHKAKESSFLRGEKGDFRLTFGWLVSKQENHQKIAEGMYNDGTFKPNALSDLRKFAEEQGLEGANLFSVSTDDAGQFLDGLKHKPA